MRLFNSPDMFKGKMNEYFNDIQYIRAYIDDLLIVRNDNFEDHLDNVKIILKKVEGADFKINAEKLFFARYSLEYLGLKIREIVIFK